MGPFLADLKFSIRALAARPGLTAAKILVLAIGIGAVSLMFSTLNTVVLRPLPFAEPDRLVWLWSTSEASRRNTVSAADYFDYRRDFKTFDSLAAYLTFRPATLLAADNEPERIVYTIISHNLLATLGVQPQMGRSFRPDEETPGGAQVVIVSQGFWQRRLGGDGKVIGRVLTLDGEPWQIVGVMPADFEFPEEVELWFPMRRVDAEAGQAAQRPTLLATHLNYSTSRGNNNFRMFGRLRDGATIEQARAEATVLADRIAAAYPDSKKGWSLLLEPMHEVFFGQYRPAMLMLMGAVVLLLLVTCANISSLFLASVLSRRSELAVRLALGASRARAAWHIMAESLVVSLAGGIAGVGLAVLGARALRALGPADLPRLHELGIDPEAVIFTTFVTIAVGLIAGAAPALRGSRVDLSEALKQTGRTTEGQGGLWLRSVLVVAQVALSLMLLVGSGLLIRSFLKLQQVDAGFGIQNLLLATVQLPGVEFDTPEKQTLFYEQMQERFRAIPGVADAGASEQLPFLAGGMWNYVSPGDRPPPSLEGRTRGIRRRASEGLFHTLGIPIVLGRAFDSRDKVGSQPVVIINQTLAALFWPNDSAIGKTLVLGSGNDGPPLEIVGVARDVREFGPDSQDQPVFYLSFAQFPSRTAQLAIRTHGDPLALAGQVKSALLELNRSVPIWSFHTMESRFADRVAQPRFRTQLLGVFAMIALVMAATGLYGVLAFFVAQRTHELGIRLALGASGRDVMRLVVGRGIILAGIGIGVGILGGLAVTRLMQTLLFQTTASDPVTFVIVSSCLAVVALLACVIPARRAQRVDPLIALRTE